MAYYDDRQYYPSRDRYAAQRPSYGQDPYSYADPRSRPYNGGYQQTQIVRHGENDDSYGYSRDPRRARVATVQGGTHRSRSVDGRGSYYEDSNYYYRHRPRHEQRSNHHSDRRRHKHSPRSPSNSPSPPRRRRKSFSEQALGALGLGAAASSASKHSRGRSQSRHHRSYSYSPSQSRGKSRHRRDKTEDKMAQAVKAALTAGAVEAFHLRKEPGEWTGDKGKRILTAAITAAGADGLVDRNPDKHAKTHIIESTLAGLAANHFVNGPRSKSRGKSRGRDRSNSGLKTAATTAALAAVGKEAYDRFRSKSRPRGRSSSRDNSDDDDSSPPRRSKKRSKSVSDYINQGMGALGLGDKGKDRRHGPSSRRDERYYSESDGDSDDESQRQEDPRRGRHSRDVGGPRFSSDTYLPSTSGISRAKSSGGYGSRRYHSNSDADSSDCGNSSDEEKQRKKINRQTLIASGLATVATIHAAHTIHHGIEKRKKRRQMVEEGQMSPEEAHRRRLKSNFADAASVGIAALGIGNAIQDWKEVDEKRKERSKFKKEAAERHERRHRRSQSATPTPRLPLALYPDEIEENTSAYGRPRVRAPSVTRDLEWNPQSHMLD